MKPLHGLPNRLGIDAWLQGRVRLAVSLLAAAFLVIGLFELIPNASAAAEVAVAGQVDIADTARAKVSADSLAARKARSLRYLNDLGASNAARRRAALLWLADNGLHQEAIQVAPLLRDEDDQNRELAEYVMWRMWGRTGDTRIDRRFDSAVRQMGGGDFEGAVKSFSTLIRDRPDLAEAWNKRATAYFMMGKLEQSLADCHEVLRRNPAHFGVLSGYGQIFARQGDYVRALEYFERALTVNPNMSGVEANIRGLRILIEEARKSST